MKTLKACETTCTSKGKAQRYICPICQETIEESNGKQQGEDSIYCDGCCKTWIHMGCLSRAAFVSFSTCRYDDEFFYPTCKLDNQSIELAFLKDIVTNFCTDLAGLMDRVTGLQISLDMVTHHAADVVGDGDSDIIAALTAEIEQ